MVGSVCLDTLLLSTPDFSIVKESSETPSTLSLSPYLPPTPFPVSPVSLFLLCFSFPTSSYISSVPTLVTQGIIVNWYMQCVFSPVNILTNSYLLFTSKHVKREILSDHIAGPFWSTESEGEETVADGGILLCCFSINEPSYIKNSDCFYCVYLLFYYENDKRDVFTCF